MSVNPIGAIGSESTDSNPYEKYYQSYYGGSQGYLSYRQLQSGFGQNTSKVGTDTVNTGKVSSPSECQTCKNRKYQDGSNEMDVSFKSASHISVGDAPSKVRAHEQEHVTNAYQKAEDAGGKVLQASVRIKTAVCPECGTTYVSGGETATKIAYPVDRSASKSLSDDTGLGKVFDSIA